MHQPAAYTPLESLFLFQSLLAQGVDDAAFTRVSELLRSNALVKQGATYDPARLTPDALRQLFLLLLRDELKTEAERNEDEGVAGSTGSRKRKIGSPPLPTLKDAFEHVEKIPVLVDRLYARYREHIIVQIRDEERHFATIQNQVQVLEKAENERKSKLAAQNSASPAGPGDATIPTTNLGPARNQIPPSTVKRPIPNTPVIPPKPPTGPSIAAPAIPPGQTISSSKSPQPPHRPPSVLQPPAGMLPTATRQQTPKPSTSPPADGKPESQSQRQPQPAPVQASIQRSGTGSIPQNATAGQSPLNVLDGSSASPSPSAERLASPGLARPTGALPSAHSQTASGKPVLPPSRPLHSQQASVARSSASASPTLPPGSSGPTAPPPHALPTQHEKQAAASPTPTAQRKKPPFPGHLPRPPIPEHVIRHAATPASAKRASVGPSSPQTPVMASPSSVTRGFGTKWATHSTPSTPGPLAAEPESPAYEPVSPPLRSATLPQSTSKQSSISKALAPKAAPSQDTASARGRGRMVRGGPKTRGSMGTLSSLRSRRSQSVVSTADELSMDQSELESLVKDEATTPRRREGTGDTTADESTFGRPSAVTPSSISSRIPKRKRQETPPPLPTAPTQVLWTRGFTKVSSSALDQISSHRDANMFANAIRERDAPGYKRIVLEQLNIASIRAAIKQGNRAAVQVAASLPGGDPGTASVWLPLSEDLVPPRGIINSAQLESELVHMFCNAIMYNPDPDRGFGPSFMKRSQEEEEDALGYRMDQFGVVRNTRNMFVEVEKFLSDLRSAEKDRSAPPPSAPRTGSVATPADDTADEEEQSAEPESVSGTSKRRRVTRG